MSKGKKSHHGASEKDSHKKHSGKHEGSKDHHKHGGKKDRGPTRATSALTKRDVDFKVRSYEHDPAEESYGMEAAYALDVAPKRIFKTLIADVDGALVVGLVQVDRELDLKSLANAVGGRRAEMAEAATAERASGYVLGGISPFAMRKRLPTVIDTPATDHPTVFVSGGKRGLEIELSPDDLIAMTGARVAPISRRG